MHVFKTFHKMKCLKPNVLLYFSVIYSLSGSKLVKIFIT